MEEVALSMREDMRGDLVKLLQDVDLVQRVRAADAQIRSRKSSVKMAAKTSFY